MLVDIRHVGGEERGEYLAGNRCKEGNTVDQ